MVVKKQLCTCRLRERDGVRGGGNGCHCCATAARATVLEVCSVSVPAFSAVIVAWQQPTINNSPPSTATLCQLQPIIHIEPSSTTTAASHHQLSRRHPFSCHHPATCWALAACLARAQPLLLRKRGCVGVSSSDWKWGEVTGGNVWAP